MEPEFPVPVIDLYCDESCHLEHDGHGLMALGAVLLPHDQRRVVAERIRGIKNAHDLPRTFEAKWTKISPAKVEFYLALVDEFFANESLSFRGWVARDKDRLRHTEFGQDHDTWYYKMYWEMLRPVIKPPRAHRIYIDIKDTRGGAKTEKLREVLANTYHDWSNQVIERIQIVRSDEIEVMQLADILVGALAYRSRGLDTSTAKTAVVMRIEAIAQIRLDWSTSIGASKVNLFHWRPQQTPR